MIFICSFIILFAFGCVFMFLVAGGFIIFSKDKATPTVSQPVTKTKTKPKTQLRTYIDLNGRLIELFTKAEITKAKRDGYKVVQK